MANGGALQQALRGASEGLLGAEQIRQTREQASQRESQIKAEQKQREFNNILKLASLDPQAGERAFNNAFGADFGEVQFRGELEDIKTFKTKTGIIGLRRNTKSPTGFDVMDIVKFDRPPGVPESDIENVDAINRLQRIIKFNRESGKKKFSDLDSETKRLIVLFNPDAAKTDPNLTDLNRGLEAQVRLRTGQLQSEEARTEVAKFLAPVPVTEAEIAPVAQRIIAGETVPAPAQSRGKITESIGEQILRAFVDDPSKANDAEKDVARQVAIALGFEL